MTPPTDTPAPDFGRLARVYAPLEWLSFGSALARRRQCFLADPRVACTQRALVLGDGDGRFTAALLERYPSIAVTAVDVSADMLTQLERRVRARAPSARLELHCADVRSWPVPRAKYDLVVSHFFFDCFTTRELEQLIARIAPTLAPSAHWLVSDFAIPRQGLWTPLAKLLVRFLYFAFGLLAGLRLTRLPEYERALELADFELSELESALGGTLRSELWRRTVTPGPSLPS